MKKRSNHGLSWIKATKLLLPVGAAVFALLATTAGHAQEGAAEPALEFDEEGENRRVLHFKYDGGLHGSFALNSQVITLHVAVHHGHHEDFGRGVGRGCHRH